MCEREIEWWLYWENICVSVFCWRWGCSSLFRIHTWRRGSGRVHVQLLYNCRLTLEFKVHIASDTRWMDSIWQKIAWELLMKSETPSARSLPPDLHIYIYSLKPCFQVFFCLFSCVNYIWRFFLRIFKTCPAFWVPDIQQQNLFFENYIYNFIHIRIPQVAFIGS